MLKSVDGPKGIPILGLALELFKCDNLLQYILDTSSKFRSPAKTWFGPFYLAIYVDDPKSIKTILNSDETLDKADFYRFTRLTNTIFANKKETWKVQRKILNTIRNKKKIISYSSVFLQRAQRLIESLSRNVGKSQFDVFDYIGAYTLEIMFEIAFDVDLKALDDPKDNKIIHSIEMSNKIFAQRARTLLYHLEPIYRLSTLYQHEKKYDLNNFYEDLIKNKRADWEKYDKVAKNNVELVINPFLKAENFTHEELRDSMKGLVFAGFDTTTSALSSTLLMLAMHPEVQQKAFEEINSILKEDQELDYYLIKNMTYLDLVVKESQRLFPSGPFIGRYAAEDLKLDDDVTIPAGTNILINYFKMQRDPKYWGDDAHLFIPERFESDRIKKVHPYAYIPFSGGPRNCIAYSYGAFILRLALVLILKNFEIFTDMKFEDIKIETTVTMKIVQGYQIGVKERLN